MHDSPPPARWSFGVFDVDLESGEFRKNGRRLRLQEKPLQLLGALLEEPYHVVSRQRLRERLWPADIFVDFDNGLNNAVLKLRFALNDNASTPRFIETVGRRGYRYIGPPPQPVPEPTTVRSVAPPAPPTEDASTAAISSTIETAPASSPARTNRPAPVEHLRWLRPRVAVPAVLLSVSTLAVVVFTGDAWVPRLSTAVWQPNVRAASDLKSVAVIPLTDLTRSNEDRSIAPGLTEALTTRLARLAPLRVISHNSVLPYSNPGRASPRQIGRELGVDVIVEGSVGGSGDDVVVNLRLVEAPSEQILWAESYRGSVNDLVSLHAIALEGVTRQVRAGMLGARSHDEAPRTASNSLAYETYLKGLLALQDSGPGVLARSEAYFLRAIEADPNYAPAHAGVALSYLLLETLDSRPPLAYMVQARNAIDRAMQLDPDLPEAHAAQAFYSRVFEWDWEGAERGFRRALELNPSLIMAYREYEFLLLSLGRLDEAISVAAKATAVDPLSAMAWLNEANAYYLARRYPEAEERYRRALELDPTLQPALWQYARLLQVQGRRSEAEMIERRVRADAESSPARAALLRVGTGDKATAARFLKREWPAKALGTAALAHAVIGAHDQAFEHLGEAVRQRSIRPWHLLDPGFDGMRTDPRFRALLTDLRLPASAIDALVTLPARSSDR